VNSEAELAAADDARRRALSVGNRGNKNDHMSAWLLDEDGEMLSDYEDEEDDDGDDDDAEDMDDVCDDEEHGGRAVSGMSDDDDDDDEEAGGTAAFDDAAAAAEWRRVRQAAMQDMDYPDEVDVPFETSARQRFARFRCT
jgi:hypothetical protein